jgi:hemin uptake protein HemP
MRVPLHGAGPATGRDRDVDRDPRARRDAASTTTAAATASAAAPLPEITSRELLGPRGERAILHDGRTYRLRITQNGKLILTA